MNNERLCDHTLFMRSILVIVPLSDLGFYVRRRRRWRRKSITTRRTSCSTNGVTSTTGSSCPTWRGRSLTSQRSTTSSKVTSRKCAPFNDRREKAVTHLRCVGCLYKCGCKHSQCLTQNACRNVHNKSAHIAERSPVPPCRHVVSSDEGVAIYCSRWRCVFVWVRMDSFSVIRWIVQSARTYCLCYL